MHTSYCVLGLKVRLDLLNFEAGVEYGEKVGDK